jgi:hypothetical protein
MSDIKTVEFVVKVSMPQNKFRKSLSHIESELQQISFDKCKLNQLQVCKDGFYVNCFIYKASKYSFFEKCVDNEHCVHINDSEVWLSCSEIKQMLTCDEYELPEHFIDV